MNNKLEPQDSTAPKSGHRHVAELCKKARFFLKQKKYNSALEFFDKALELEQGNVYALTGLGDVERARHNFKEAAGYYQRVIDVEANNVFALRGLGDSLRGAREYHRAIHAWLNRRVVSNT